MSNAAKKQHEEFDIKTDTRKKVIRLDRLEVEDLNCHLEYNGKRYHVLNISSFGIAFKISDTKNLPEELRNCTLYLDNVVIGEVNLRTVRRFHPEDDQQVTVLGCEVMGEPVPTSRIHAIKDANALIGEQKEAFSKMSLIPTEFRRRVFEIKDWLEALQTTVNQASKKAQDDDNINYQEYEEAYVEMIGTYLTQAMPAKNDKLHEYLPTKDQEVLKASIEFFREKLYDLIYQAPFSNRVFHKPLGYAGDYEMMNIIYREKANGDSLFAKCLNHYWVSEPAAQAVRNRANYLITRISETFKATDKNYSPTFLSVACGPAKEWQRMISEVRTFNDRTFTVNLLDQDEKALKHAQKQIKHFGHNHKHGGKFEYLNTAIKNIIARGLESEKYDLIYSAGLFDYFSDPVAQMAAMKLFAAVKKGGRLIIGNFNVTNPNSMMMNLALDWHLIYRSEDDLKRLFAPLGGKMRVDKEDLDINLFCVIEKE